MRRARTRSALLEAAARGFSTYGYANVALERVANEAGHTRGALYQLFADKEDLALAVVRSMRCWRSPGATPSTAAARWPTS